ncbi:hypothetical protein E4K72_14285 [Oxalobacteraceae bacterium OM1]|nr:hypothetical protein E4K72_14285 [Oxalobacteraceae bacterium OM1]
MRLTRSQEQRIILALAEFEAADPVAYRRLRRLACGAFALGVLLLGCAVAAIAAQVQSVYAALASLAAGVSLGMGLHFRLALLQWPVVQRYLDRDRIHRSLWEY